jgi:hypothetical protein
MSKPNPLAPNPLGIANYSATQAQADGTTSGVTAGGAQVSLVLNDVDPVAGQALVPAVPNHVTFAFTHATSGLATGVTVTGYTPSVGDIITAVWFEVDTAFNGTTPLADVGFFSSTEGIFKELNSNAVDLTVADSAVADNTGLDKIGAACLGPQVAGFPLRVASTSNPLLLVVSETGAKNGTASGATLGAAVLHMIVVPAGAGPSSFPQVVTDGVLSMVPVWPA